MNSDDMVVPEFSAVGRKVRRRWDPVPDAALVKAHDDACAWATKAEADADKALDRADKARALVEERAAKLEAATLEFEHAATASKTAYRASVVALCEKKAAFMAKATTEHALNALRRANE
jgi:hypothetical protein